MGFLSKIFKPVSKVLDKIIPNEIKPALPYLAAFAPMLAPGIMGSSMLSRGLMSGGLNIGAQLAQEGNEGEVNALSALMASGIGALSAPGSTGGRTLPDGSGGSYSQVMGGDKLASVGTPSAGEYLRGVSDTGSFADKGLEFLGEGADKLSALNAAGAADPFSTAGLKAAALPFSQATGDLAYADAQRALRDYEDSQNADSGYAEGDQNRGLAVRRAMERGGHEEQTIQDMLESLGYEDPDPQPLAYGGRVNAMGGGIMSNQRMNFRGGGMDYMPTEPRMMGNPAVMETIQAGDDMREFRIMNPNMEDVADYSIEFKEEVKEPDFGGIKEAIENVDIKEKEENLEDIKDLMAYEPGEATTGDLYDMKNPDYDGINPKVIREFIEEGIPLGYTSPEEYFDDFYGIGSLKKDKPQKKMMAKEGGIMNGYNMGGSVLPQDMEMDYRGGGFIPMGSKERADDVPARVSKNEFVMTADAVRAAGGGSVNQGAKRMYELMNNLEARI